MCQCVNDKIHPEYTISIGTVSQNLSNSDYTIPFIIKRQYATLSDWCLASIGEPLLVAEKILEVGDEAFHLLGSTLQALVRPELYQFFYELHESAHLFESVLHSSAVIWDIARLKEIFHEEFLLRICRIAQLIGHGLAGTAFLANRKIIEIKDPFYSNVVTHGCDLFNGFSFGLRTIHLIWHRSHAANFYTDLAIYGGGAARSIFSLAHSYTNRSELVYLQSVATLIHAVAVLYKRAPTRFERMGGTFSVAGDPSALTGKVQTLHRVAEQDVQTIGKDPNLPKK